MTEQHLKQRNKTVGATSLLPNARTPISGWFSVRRYHSTDGLTCRIRLVKIWQVMKN